MAYREWGPETAARTLVCVHGLTRGGRDFDHLAADLAEHGWRVVCPDVAGRGKSDRLTNPADYAVPQYVADMTALIARLGVDRVDWLGTSMGGLVGMSMAALPNNPIARLVINDVGPFVPKAALERIADYLGKPPPAFATPAEAEAHLRLVHAPFGDLSDAEWAHLTAVSTVPEGDGWRLHYDPAIGDSLAKEPPQDLDLWMLWDAIACPTLVLRGAESDLLLAETAAEMARRGPKAQIVEFAGCGHAPPLLAADQIAAVRDWLAG